MQNQEGPVLPTKREKEELEKKHDFWDTQPVLHRGETAEEVGPIDAIKTVDEVRKEPYNLPAGFEWAETDISLPETMDEVYELLNGHYVEDDDHMFRFDYSREFLRWALTPPGYLKTWHIGVRVTKTKKLIGYITAIPARISVYKKEMNLVEINFLCVHKKLRDKRLAPVLIKEITRRVNLTNIWQAAYTAGRTIPTPIARCRYWHRSLNPKKLIDVGFSHLPNKMTITTVIKLYRLPEKPHIPNIRPLEKRDIPQATKLLSDYLQRFDIHATFNEEEFAHWFTPQENIVNTYVVENPQTKEITDLTSFYTLPSSVLGHPRYSTLKAAYSYYSVANTVSITELMKDALIFARLNDFDVYNCLDIMENGSGTNLKDLKFGRGDGNLQYYLYNWRCPEIVNSKSRHACEIGGVWPISKDKKTSKTHTAMRTSVGGFIGMPTSSGKRKTPAHTSTRHLINSHERHRRQYHNSSLFSPSSPVNLLRKRQTGSTPKSSPLLTRSGSGLKRKSEPDCRSISDRMQEPQTFLGQIDEATSTGSRLADIPLRISAVMFVLYCLMPYEDNLFRPFIRLSHEAGLNVKGDMLYDKGWKDALFVAYYVMIFTWLRDIVMKRILRPMGIRLSGIIHENKIQRYEEQGYAVLYYTASTVFGLIVMYHEDTWFFNTRHFWENYPHIYNTALFKSYYLLQLAFWLQQAIVLLLGLELARKDFTELICHHIVTISLILLSYYFNYTRIGNAVFLTMDSSDIFLALAKLLNYGPKTKKASEPAFVFFILVWCYTRHYQFGWLVMGSTWTEYYPVLLTKGGIDASQGWFAAPWIFWVMFSLMAILQALCIFWLFLILRIMVVFLLKGGDKASDDREDDEDQGEVVKELREPLAANLPAEEEGPDKYHAVKC
ncbi:glycylpeptide N-tetradecanoyltransferase 2 [Planoprotostelium fungivorum]|uniref:Glycylpeptide N-tetradecanoyltransferase n=1 Tax=Planoprotostelium fungivorum TaxID=1890364 RepID=A0A2P6NY26_9EUKA|nr:glycylpeptide N-tetradecanoyltransferase 2 [Planoprotostelium fungivorum]